MPALVFLALGAGQQQLPATSTTPTENHSTTSKITRSGDIRQRGQDPWRSIRCGKDTGLSHLPSRVYAINQVWCVAASIACDLLAWLRLLALDGDLARAEPKT
ncbi:MAG: hypothetical protein ACRDRL_20905, partial [Sciscionella sp.]